MLSKDNTPKPDSNSRAPLDLDPAAGQGSPRSVATPYEPDGAVLFTPAALRSAAAKSLKWFLTTTCPWFGCA